MNWRESPILVRVTDGKAIDLKSILGRVFEFLIFICTTRNEIAAG